MVTGISQNWFAGGFLCFFFFSLIVNCCGRRLLLIFPFWSTGENIKVCNILLRSPIYDKEEWSKSGDVYAGGKSYSIITVSSSRCVVTYRIKPLVAGLSIIHPLYILVL